MRDPGSVSPPRGHGRGPLADPGMLAFGDGAAFNVAEHRRLDRRPHCGEHRGHEFDEWLTEGKARGWANCSIASCSEYDLVATRTRSNDFMQVVGQHGRCGNGEIAVRAYDAQSIAGELLCAPRAHQERNIAIRTLPGTRRNSRPEPPHQLPEHA